MLTTAELAQLRAAVNRLLLDQVEIQRPMPVRQPDGSVADDWQPVATLACRVGPAPTPHEQQLGGQLRGVTPVVFTLPAGSDVQGEDRLIWQGRTFNVSGAPGARSDELSRRVVAVETV